MVHKIIRCNIFDVKSILEWIKQFDTFFSKSLLLTHIYSLSIVENYYH